MYLIKKKKIIHNIYCFQQKLIVILFLIIISLPAAKSAEKMSFINGAFSRTITIKNIEGFAKTGKANGVLSDLLKFSNEEPKEIVALLNKEYELPLMLTSKLIHSRIGAVVISRVAKIIYPLRLPNNKVSVLAIRAGIINGLVSGKGKITLILFLKNYPNKNIAVNIPSLTKVLKKVETINGLVKFFSESPLEVLKERRR